MTTGDGRTVPVTVRRTSDGDGIDVADVFVATALVKSKGDARRLLQQGGLYVNGDKLAPGVTVLLRSDAIHGAYYVLRKGARDIAVGMGLWSAAAHGGNYAPWLLARAICDGGDTLAALLDRRGLCRAGR